MPYPTIYPVAYSYTGFQESQGNNSFPGTQLDADLRGLQDSISSLALFVRRVVRSDGKLANGLVTYDSLAASLQPAGLADVRITPVGSISSTNVQDAIEELDTEKASIANLAAVAFSGAAADISFAGVTNLTGGRIKFPATQSASSDLNTIDDYKEGTFTPTLTFATPGNLSVTYSECSGFYTKIGNKVTATIRILTSAFTWTTASGNLLVSGLPFAAANVTGNRSIGSLYFGGINKAGYSQVNSRIAQGVSNIGFNASGMGVANSAVVAADVPSGGAVELSLTITYFTA